VQTTSEYLEPCSPGSLVCRADRQTDGIAIVIPASSTLVTLYERQKCSSAKTNIFSVNARSFVGFICQISQLYYFYSNRLMLWVERTSVTSVTSGGENNNLPDSVAYAQFVRKSQRLWSSSVYRQILFLRILYCFRRGNFEKFWCKNVIFIVVFYSVWRNTDGKSYFIMDGYGWC